ncbi:MAG: transporter [Thermonemataceae bacterium]
MTDLEYDILDELYFVNPFRSLIEELDMAEQVLKPLLWQLLQKGWIKCMSPKGDETITDLSNFEQEYKNYHYLATKSGLLAHNRKD